MAELKSQFEILWIKFDHRAQNRDRSLEVSIVQFDLGETPPCSDEVLFELHGVLELNARLHIILLFQELLAAFVIVLRPLLR